MAGALSLAACLVVGAVLLDSARTSDDAGDSLVLTAQQIQQLSALATTRVKVATVASRRIEGVTGSLQAVIAVEAEVLLGVDLSQARLQEVDHRARTAVLCLPDPQVLAVNVHHQHAIIHDMSASGAWLLLPPSAGRGELLMMTLEQAQQQLRAQAGAPPRVALARQHAEAVIARFVESQCGWRLTIRWN